ncbi:MAG: hypothetical protein P4L46_25430 [Fimbriimonas sp.]|nr:hypothetical protein [Fimbriimonas sp.]
MHQVQIADQLYQEAEKRARVAGFATVDEYVADALAADLHEEGFDHLFTPERIAHFDRISAEVKAGGKTYTPDEVREHFRKKWEGWPENPTS